MLVVNGRFCVISKLPFVFSYCSVNRPDELNGYKVKLNTEDWNMSQQISFVTQAQRFKSHTLDINIFKMKWGLCELI